MMSITLCSSVIVTVYVDLYFLSSPPLINSNLLIVSFSHPVVLGAQIVGPMSDALDLSIFHTL